MDIIATIGPSILTKSKVTSLVDKGVTIFRINGAHNTTDSVARTAREIRGFIGNRARIMLDLPTNKVRTANLNDPIILTAGETFLLHPDQLNFPELRKFVEVGDEVLVNDGHNLLTAVALHDEAIEFKSDSDGTLGNNRGLIFQREIHQPGFPFFFPRDLELIEIVNDMELELVGVSYLRYSSDKEEAIARIHNKDSLVYKIETRVALSSYSKLIKPGERILIDRGDLAGEIGLVHVPKAQEELIRFAHRNRIEVYLATQFLTSMQHSPIPRIAEVCALFETCQLGVDAVQLSEETAVGNYPTEAVEWIKRIERSVAGKFDVDAATYGEAI